jgi:hypothetical protein
MTSFPCSDSIDLREPVISTRKPATLNDVADQLGADDNSSGAPVERGTF